MAVRNTWCRLSDSPQDVVSPPQGPRRSSTGTILREMGAAASDRKQREHYGSLDLLRHLFTVGVIFLHMTSTTRYSPELNLAIGQWGDKVDGVVMGFFLISGFFFKAPVESGVAALVSFLREKLVRYGIPYLAFSLLYTVLLSLLGKVTLDDGLRHTFFGHGQGMQLYFLPYLFGVTLVWYVFSGHLARALAPRAQAVVVMVAAALVSLGLPTSGSTGPSYSLLSLYFLAFVSGCFFRLQPRGDMVLQAAAPLCVCAFALGWVDPRFFDLLFVIVLFSLAIYLHECEFVSRRCFPGSGGVYLLHTPILNFALSGALIALNIGGLTNVLLSVSITYALCLVFTLGVIGLYPRLRVFLLE